MNTAQKFNSLYNDVARNIEQTLKDISGLKVDNKEGKAHLNVMTEQLSELHNNFSNELLFLEQNAEWDKFTLAFFGETNAGKSTLIESLRILFNEGSRQQLLASNENDLNKAEQALTTCVEQVRADFGTLYSDMTQRVSDIHCASLELVRIIDSESALRLKVELDESQSRQQLELEESAARLAILEKTSFAKSRNKIFASAFIGLAIGAGAMYLISELAGH
ncbi:hypothetical protein [Serratia silvae]|uniref:Uncharacterized protein n=1 Tax=Serratia silvae TaxID=2824122 RepID=A0ABT0K907_9GAMM|nr:hypothetical protein [Serratia silvae]MCL1028523.1 hypothetical protein [Serratia silvae]